MKWGKSVYQSLTMITQFGINMLVPIFLCSFIGMYLDRKLGTSFIMILLFFVGALAGFRNVYVFAKNIYTKPSHKRSNQKTKVKGIDTNSETVGQGKSGKNQ